MSGSPLSDSVAALTAASGQEPSARGALFSILYDELRRVAAELLTKESPGLTLQPTALVHEAYLRLVDQSRATIQDRAHFCAVAAQAMRRILVDHARARHAQKRGGQWTRVTLDGAVALSDERDVDLEALDGALQRLAEENSREAAIVELRFFGGLGNVEVAEVLRVSVRTVEDDWRFARAWLRRELNSARGSESP